MGWVHLLGRTRPTRAAPVRGRFRGAARRRWNWSGAGANAQAEPGGAEACRLQFAGREAADVPVLSTNSPNTAQWSDPPESRTRADWQLKWDDARRWSG